MFQMEKKESYWYIPLTIYSKQYMCYNINDIFEAVGYMDIFEAVGSVIFSILWRWKTRQKKPKLSMPLVRYTYLSLALENSYFIYGQQTLIFMFSHHKCNTELARLTPIKNEYSNGYEILSDNSRYKAILKREGTFLLNISSQVPNHYCVGFRKVNRY